jgi:hypothetical protein
MVSLSKILKILVKITVISGVMTFAGFFLMFSIFPHSSTSSTWVVNPPDLQLSKNKRLQPNYTYEIRLRAYVYSDYSNISINASFSISSEIQTLYSRTLTDNTSEYVTKIFRDYDPDYGSYEYEENVWEVTVEDTVHIGNLTSSDTYEITIHINSFSSTDSGPGCSLLIQSNPTEGGGLSGLGLVVFIVTVVSFLALFFSLPMLIILGIVKLISTTQHIGRPVYPSTEKCPNCNMELVERHEFCPACGRPASIKRTFWTLKKAIILFLVVWLVSTIFASLLFFPEVSGEIGNPTMSGLPADQTERLLLILFLLFLLGLISSFMFIMIPFTMIIGIISVFFFYQKQKRF